MRAHPETADSRHSSLGRATRLPHGACRRPHPVAAKKRFRFCPAPTSSPWMFAFASPRSRKRRKPCQSLASVLGFSKERLDPDLPFAHRLPEDLGRAVAADLLPVVSIEGPVHDAAVVGGRALDLDGTGIAERRVGPIDDLLLGGLGLAAWQELALWAAVQV